MDGDTQLIENWLKENCGNQSTKPLIPNKDVIEAIYSLIDEWKCNKEVKNSSFLHTGTYLQISFLCR